MYKIYFYSISTPCIFKTIEISEYVYIAHYFYLFYHPLIFSWFTRIVSIKLWFWPNSLYTKYFLLCFGQINILVATNVSLGNFLNTATNRHYVNHLVALLTVLTRRERAFINDLPSPRSQTLKRNAKISAPFVLRLNTPTNWDFVRQP